MTRAPLGTANSRRINSLTILFSTPEDTKSSATSPLATGLCASAIWPIPTLATTSARCTTATAPLQQKSSSACRQRKSSFPAPILKGTWHTSPAKGQPFRHGVFRFVLPRQLVNYCPLKNVKAAWIIVKFIIRALNVTNVPKFALWLDIAPRKSGSLQFSSNFIVLEFGSP